MFNNGPSNANATIRATGNDLSPFGRKEIADLLNRRLADTIDLMLQAKQAHWTVKGPNFLSLHELFDKIAEGAGSHSDLLAERVMQLGGIAEGTVQVVGGITKLDAYPVAISDWRAHVGRMSNALAKSSRA